MPKSSFKNPFNRRRSAGNILDAAAAAAAAAEIPASPSAESSFKVLERPDRNTINGATWRPQSQARLSQARPFNSPLQQLRGKSAEDLGPGTNRGSGGTTNSGSSGYYDSSSASARYSSTSTLPSSVEQEREPIEDDLFPKKRATAPMYHSVSASADAPLPPPPSFSSRASRALSFGLKSKQPVIKPEAAPSLPTSPVYGGAPTASEPEEGSTRERAMTTSSYASTAVPAKVDAKPNLGSSDFGNDFGNDFGVNMFDSLKPAASSSESLPPPPPVGGFHRTESEPIFPPRSYSRQGFTPSPIQLKSARDDAGSPYSWDGRNSNDGLVSNSALSSPRTDVGPGLPSIAHGIAPAFLGGSKQGYSLVPERNGSPGIERTSPYESAPSDSRNNETGFTNRQTQLDDGDRWARKYELHDPQETKLSTATAKSSLPTPASSSTSSLKPRPSTAAPISPESSEGGSHWADESQNTTPRAVKFQPRAAVDESMFDVSPSGPPSRAIRPGSSSHHRTQSGTPKKMTKAQFEMLRKHDDENPEHDVAQENSGDEYDDEDDEETAKHMTRQRRKQEANMAVYRQQMKKVTGGGPSDLPAARPGMDRASQSASGIGGLHLGGMGGTPPSETIRGKNSDDDDEDVPLGILQAHGFPSSSRPPTSLGEDLPGMRRGSVAGSIAGGAGQGNLPAFARRLPADPYFGAGLVNPATRESLAFSSAGSVYGGSPAVTPMGNPMPTPGGHPGGLVGVIAGEERAKAARRANPNATGYGQSIPLPGNMGMPQMPRTMSMGNLPPPSLYPPSGMPPMPMMPQMPMMNQGPDPTQQMQQFMQMQMQFMQNMMSIQQASMGQGMNQQMPQMQQQPSNGFLAPPPAGNRPNTMAGQAPNQGRSMTMMHPPSNWGGAMQRPTSSFHPQSNYAPSMHNLNISGGPGQGYTPSIAPSERSNVGMPSRYRPVQICDGSGRSQSMTSSTTLQALQGPQPAVQPLEEQRKSTVRVVDKPKGAPKVSSRAVDPDEDEDEGWAEMAKKRNEKKFRWGRKEKQSKQEPALSELYQNFD